MQNNKRTKKYYLINFKNKILFNINRKNTECHIHQS